MTSLSPGPPPDLGGYKNLVCGHGQDGYHLHVSLIPKRNLPRLERHHYCGHAVVFWTLTLEKRARGWLTAEFHFICFSR